MVSMSKCVWQKSVLHLMSKGGHVVYGLESLKGLVKEIWNNGLQPISGGLQMSAFVHFLG